jgi:hypothetical protein
MSMALPIAQVQRLLLFAVLSALAVLSAPVFLALHDFLCPGLDPGDWMFIELGIWVVAFTTLFAILFRFLGLRAFLLVIGMYCTASAIIASTTGGFELLHLIYFDGSYIPPYYVAVSIADVVLLLGVWEIMYRFKIRSSIRFVMIMTIVALLIVGLPGYLLVYRIH